MMPPTDEFDVNMLVSIVNESQRTMMKVLQIMLQRAKFELKYGIHGHRSQGSEKCPFSNNNKIEGGEDKAEGSKQLRRNSNMESCNGLAGLAEFITVSENE